jgi:hypothetical protein
MLWAIPLAAFLSVTVAGEDRVSLGTEDREPARPVEIPEVRYLGVPGTLEIHRLRLRAASIARVIDHEDIELLVATYGTSPRLEGGELLLLGTDCVYRTREGADIRNNGFLAFTRGPDCKPLRGDPTGTIQLTLRLSTSGRVALWTRPKSKDDSPGGWSVADRTASPTGPDVSVTGRLVNRYPAERASRASLVAYVWQLPWSDRWVWFAVLIPAGMIAFAVLLWPGGPRTRAVSGGHIVRIGVAGALVAASIGASYAVFVPPFQAPDEPVHFTAFTYAARRPNVSEAAATWARIAHYQRIKFHPDQHFTPTDRHRPDADGLFVQLPYEDRGMAMDALWRSLGPMLKDLSPQKMLLALRLFDVLLFALTVGLSIAILGVVSGTRWPELLIFPLFFVPALSFFAMAVSNYALLMDAYVLVAAGVLLHFYDGPRAAWAGPILGIAWGFALLASRSAMPIVAVLAAIASTRIAVGSGRNGVTDAVTYWLGLALAMAGTLYIAGAAYLQPLAERIHAVSEGPLARLFDAVIRHPFLLVLVPIGAIPLEVGTARLLRRQRTPVSLHSRASRALSGFAWIAAIFIVGTLLVSIVVRFPRLPLRDPSFRDARAYAIQLLVTFATSFRLRSPDFFTSTSFWGGFGWLETAPPDWFVSILAGASGVATAWFAVSLARGGSAKARVSFAALLVGVAASLVLYAMSIIRLTTADVVGRYLSGLSLAVLTVGWSVLARHADTGDGRRGGRVLVGCGVSWLAVQQFCLALILRRYF